MTRESTQQAILRLITQIKILYKKQTKTV